jgi:hypothetical protein
MKSILLAGAMMRALLLVGCAALLMATSANAGPEAEHRGHWVSPGQWQMNDIGRNHGVLGGPGIPKCNSPLIDLAQYCQFDLMANKMKIRSGGSRCCWPLVERE